MSHHTWVGIVVASFVCLAAGEAMAQPVFGEGPLSVVLGPELTFTDVQDADRILAGGRARFLGRDGLYFSAGMWHSTESGMRHQPRPDRIWYGGFAVGAESGRDELVAIAADVLVGGGTMVLSQKAVHPLIIEPRLVTSFGLVDAGEGQRGNDDLVEFRVRLAVSLGYRLAIAVVEGESDDGLSGASVSLAIEIGFCEVDS